MNWNSHSDTVLVKMIHNILVVYVACATHDISVCYHKVSETGGKRQANISPHR